MLLSAETNQLLRIPNLSRQISIDDINSDQVNLNAIFAQVPLEKVKDLITLSPRLGLNQEPFHHLFKYLHRPIHHIDAYMWHVQRCLDFQFFYHRIIFETYPLDIYTEYVSCLFFCMLHFSTVLWDEGTKGLFLSLSIKIKQNCLKTLFCFILIFKAAYCTCLRGRLQAAANSWPEGKWFFHRSSLVNMSICLVDCCSFDVWLRCLCISFKVCKPWMIFTWMGKTYQIGTYTTYFSSYLHKENRGLFFVLPGCSAMLYWKASIVLSKFIVKRLSLAFR